MVQTTPHVDNAESLIATTAQPQRVLVVEDQIELAAYAKRGLEREGYVVDVASQNEQAIAMATNDSYHAIVIDGSLAGAGGFEVCDELRRHGVWVPIIMLTSEQDDDSALRCGADDALPRHFAAATLVTRLRSLLRRDAGGPPNVVRVGDIHLDPAKRSVRVGEDAVELTPTEFCIFEHLLRRRGEVVSKQDLLDSCWEWAFDGDANIVEVYVGLLRKKIDAPFGRAQLRTVRGAGYRIAPHHEVR